MAAPRENSLSLGRLTDRNTFTNRRDHNAKKSFKKSMVLQDDFSPLQSLHYLRMMHLQQRWQELKDRECEAQQRNRQLLQEFEEAQNILREMMTHNAAMKTIRVEYERYLEENSTHWQQQLKEKTQAAQRKRMEEYLKMCLRNTGEEQVSSADQPLPSRGATRNPQRVTAPRENYSQNIHSVYSQDGVSHAPYSQSSWLTRPDPARFPVRESPYRPPGSSQAPPRFLPHPLLFHRQPPQPRQDPPPGVEAVWGQLYTQQQDAPPEVRGAAEEAETSRASSSRTERSSRLSQELDVRPVRLSSGHAESGESCSDSREKKKKKRKREKREREEQTSERERCSSQESSKASSAIVIASFAVDQTSRNEASSEKSSGSSRKTRSRIRGRCVVSPMTEKAAEELSRSTGEDGESHNEESQSSSEESGRSVKESGSEIPRKESQVKRSNSCRDESESQEEEASGSVSIKLKNEDADGVKEENFKSDQSDPGEKVMEGKGDSESGEELEGNCAREDEKEGRDVENEEEEVSAEKDEIDEEEEETGAEDEMEEQESDEDQGDEEETGSDRLKNDGEIRKQEEEVEEEENERSEEDDDEGSDEEEEEEQRSDKEEEPEDEIDSDDSIISPRYRPKKMHVIPEESAEDDDGKQGSKTGSSEDDSNEFGDEDDIEQLLAPQTPTKKKEEQHLKTVDKPKDCDKVEIFQVEPDQSDSDEFDHFYD